jgi:hypothetical protein
VSRIRILDPTAAPPATDPDPGPDIGSLSGKTIGLRFDRAWRSWLWVMDEWEAGNRIGVDGEETFSALGVFAADVDAALVGLGN